jgi:formylglycine-generating enzyme required for sulfatase activity
MALRSERAMALVLETQREDAGSALARDMAHIPGGTFRMGSDQHYPEEAPTHRVTVDSFWIDRTPVTNAQFRGFVDATGYVTFAEIAPKAEDYPGALPHMLCAGSLVFDPPMRPVDLGDWSQWWNFKFGANWRKPYGPGSSIKAPCRGAVYRGRFALAAAGWRIAAPQSTPSPTRAVCGKAARGRPIAEAARSAMSAASSLDHLVGAGEDVRRER